MGEGLQETLDSYNQCSGTTGQAAQHQRPESIMGSLYLGYTGLTLLKIYEGPDYFGQGFNTSALRHRALLSVHR